MRVPVKDANFYGEFNMRRSFDVTRVHKTPFGYRVGHDLYVIFERDGDRVSILVGSDKEVERVVDLYGHGFIRHFDLELKDCKLRFDAKQDGFGGYRLTIKDLVREGGTISGTIELRPTYFPSIVFDFTLNVQGWRPRVEVESWCDGDDS